jgi:hypothetical protein
MKLIKLIYPNQKVNRSINLERDKGKEDPIESYQITGKGIEILRRFLSALNGERIFAWSLTGPYGMGKSAFINFLLALTGQNNLPIKEIAMKKLLESDYELGKKLTDAIDKTTKNKGFLNIPVTASYESINSSIAKSILNAVSNNGLNENERTSIQNLPIFNKLLNTKNPDTHLLIKCLLTLRKKFDRPIFLAIDELGKNLEFMAHYPEKGDIFILQLLAETADIYLWVCLHQSFEGYASGLNNQQKKEWNKVQGRFEDISFIETTTQMLSLLKRVIIQNSTLKDYKILNDWAISFIKFAKKENIPYLEEMTEQEVIALYPFHPTAAIVLPELCRRFAQNDRTLFSFLGNGDPRALPEFLKKHSITKDKLPFLGIDYLYDYFFSVSTSAFINRPEAQKWVEIQNIIEQSLTLSHNKQAILKTIGILNLISSQFSLPARPEVLQCIIRDILGLENEKTKKILGALKKSIIFYREYAQEYRLWEGSDFDILKAIEDKKSKLAMNKLEEILQEYSPLNDKIAARHSYQTGTIRKYECKWIDIATVTEGNIPSPSQGYDGLLLYAFGSFNQLQNIPETCPDGRPLVILYAAKKNQIKELILEAAAVKIVLNESPELASDGVARKEVRYRIYMAEDNITRYINKIYSPNSEESICYIGSNIKRIDSYKKFSLLLSSLCDKAYFKCPKINNEMINYNKLSTSAARARRELAEAMVTKENEEQLGLVGFGPEVALYRTLLRSTELHKNINGKWKFVNATDSDSKLLSVWSFIDELLQSTENDLDKINISMIIEKIKNPPFGMREGPIPIILCHYLVVNSDEIALYQEEIYKPYFGEAEISLLIKRPELFSLKRFAKNSIRRDVIKTYFEVLNSKEISFNDNLRNTSLLKIISPLLKFVDSLPKYSRQTRRISLPSQKLRSVLLNSREPISLLFEEIPEAIGFSKIDFNKNDDYKNNTLGELLERAILELARAYDVLNEEIKKYLMEAFGWDPLLDDFQVFRKEIHKKYFPVFSSNLSKEVKSIIGALVNEQCDDDEWARSIAGLIVKKPVHSWHDSDIEPFRINLFDTADRIQSFRKLGFASGGFQDNNSVVISFTGSEGKMIRKLIHLDAKTRENIEKEYTNILNQPEKIREALCFILSESLKENK